MKRYGVIILDPAWRYSNVGTNGAAEKEYQRAATTGRSTMSMAEIMALPVPALLDETGVVLLWATWPLLDMAIDIGVRGWGLDYVTGLPWIKIEDDPSRDLWGELSIKPQWGVGWWVRGCSEPILIFRRGKPDLPSQTLVGLLSENFGHSRKPDNLHHLAETLRGPYLEMFARRPRASWDLWGNQAPDSIDLAPYAHE